LFLLPPKILCIASLRKLFLAAAGAKQDGQKSGFILFAFPSRCSPSFFVTIFLSLITIGLP
jgi:hypothetical protein